MSKDKDPKPESKEKKPGVMSRIAHGVGSLIQGSIQASDKALDFAQRTREKSATGVLGKKKSKFHVDERQESILFERKFIDGKEYYVKVGDEFQPVTEEQEEDDGYFGITDPGLTAPTMTMGIRNSFGEFFGSAADAMQESEQRKR